MPEAREVAYPLFDYAVVIAAITQRLSYRSRLCRHPKHWVILVLQGTMNVHLEGRDMTAGPGQLIMVPVWTLVRYSSVEPVWWLYIQMDDIDHWKPLTGIGPYIRDYESAPLLFLQLRTILDARITQNPRDVLLARHCSRAVIHLLQHEMEVMSGGVNPRRKKVRDLMEAIALHPQHHWTVEEMAERVAVSPGHLTTIFREELRVSPLEAVIRHRMKSAMTLLATSDRLLEDIAASVGYRSLASFARLFRKHVGMPPGQFRKTQRQKGRSLEPAEPNLNS